MPAALRRVQFRLDRILDGVDVLVRSIARKDEP
jgi:hypothetical protein